MADEKFVFSLPPDTRKNLENMAADLEKITSAMNTLTKVGIDTTQLAKQLEWAKGTRDILLKEFK